MKRYRFAPAIFILLILLVSGCATTHAPENIAQEITIVHVNDTHSHLEPAEVTLYIDGRATKAQLGGFTRLKSALDELRGSEANMIFLHAGDMVQGTLYFSRYRGSADMYMLNLLGLDVTTLGNHEFDRGPELLANMIESANFNFVSSNIDVSRGVRLYGKVAPYVIKQLGKERIGIIGLTTIEAPHISNPGTDIKFNNTVASVKAAVKELNEKGVNRLIVLSHCGYEEDMALAKAVTGLQVIVGGHTHTLLGDAAGLAMLGLKAEGQYPTVVKNPAGRDVLIVQSWEWAKMLGVLRVTINSAGEITAWSAAPRLVTGPSFKRDGKAVEPGSADYSNIVAALKKSGMASIYEDDKTAAARVDIYKGPIKEMMSTLVATAPAYLKRGNNSGPGPVAADAMLWKTKASGSQIAVLNTGGVRRDLGAGNITLADIYELMPFNNTLVLIDIKGSELIDAIEEGVEYQIASGSKPPYLYVAGVTFRLDEKAAKGKRINDIKVRQADGSYEPFVKEQVYSIVVNSYLADGGDGMVILKRASQRKIDTGFIDAEVMIEYLRELGTVNEQKEKRISQLRPDIIFGRIELTLHELRPAA